MYLFLMDEDTERQRQTLLVLVFWDLLTITKTWNNASLYH